MAGSSFDFTVSTPVPIETAHRVLKTPFGDGYVQRSKDGINSRKRQWRVEIKNKLVTTIEEAERFLDENAGVHPFLFNPGDLGAPVRVICEEYTARKGNRLGSLQAVFEEYMGP
jgi:phage-related protein